MKWAVVKDEISRIRPQLQQVIVDYLEAGLPGQSNAEG